MMQQFAQIWYQSQPPSVVHVSPDIRQALITALEVGNCPVFFNRSMPGGGIIGLVKSGIM